MPVAVGLNSMLTVQLDPPPRLDPQVLLVIGKSDLVPVSVMLLMVTDELLSLVIVTLNVALVLPTVTGPKFNAVGDTARATPVPVRLAVCGLPGALSVMDSVPVRVPPCVGLKLTFTMQLAPAPSELPQAVFGGAATRAKSPLTAMLVIETALPPVFLTVTVFAPLVAPTWIFENIKEVGVKVMVPPPLAVTVRLTEVVCVKLPDTPVMVTVDVPVVAVALAVNVSVLDEVVGFGLNAAVTPLGNPVALKVTLPEKPLTGTTAMLLVPVLP